MNEDIGSRILRELAGQREMLAGHDKKLEKLEAGQGRLFEKLGASQAGLLEKFEAGQAGLLVKLESYQDQLTKALCGLSDATQDQHWALLRRIDGLEGQMNHRFQQVDVHFANTLVRFDEVDRRLDILEARRNHRS